MSGSHQAKIKGTNDYTLPKFHARRLKILMSFSDPPAPYKRNRGDDASGSQSRTKRRAQVKAAFTCVELENSFKWSDVVDKVSPN
jgi:hypothetical protein